MRICRYGCSKVLRSVFGFCITFMKIHESTLRITRVSEAHIFSQIIHFHIHVKQLNLSLPPLIKTNIFATFIYFHYTHKLEGHSLLHADVTAKDIYMDFYIIVADVLSLNSCFA